MRLLLLGCGKIGRTIADLLSEDNRFQLTLADASEKALAAAIPPPGRSPYTTRALDVTSAAALANAMTGQDAVINALPHYLNTLIAEQTVTAGCAYFDLSEDVAATQRIHELSKSARRALMPQCGLAPGFINIVTHDLCQRFDRLDEVHCRVGALPVYPTGSLKYNLTWSTDGLINEYCKPCEIIHEGEKREVLPLEGLETFALEGVTYECFNTSGGIGSLCETLAGKVRHLTYKSIRYPGHAELMKFLLSELGMSRKRALLRELLEDALPQTGQDVVLVFVTATGWRDNRFVQETFVRRVYGGIYAGLARTAIQITTAAGLCSVLDLYTRQQLPQQGFIRQEQVKMADFLASPFARAYLG